MKTKLFILLAGIFSISQTLAGELSFDDVNTAGSETYYCTEGESCLISCSGAEACKDATFYGADNFDLTLNCSGDRSCSNSNVHGPSKGKFTINLADGIYPIWASRLYAQKSLSLHINSSNVTYETHYLHLHVPRETFITDDNWVDGNSHQTTMFYARFYFTHADGHRIYMNREQASDFWENSTNSTVSCAATDDTSVSLDESNLQLCNADVRALTSADMMLVGMAGIKGDTGAQGPQGETGEQGLPGSNNFLVNRYKGVSGRESLSLSASSNSICFLTKVDGKGACKILEEDGYWILKANQPQHTSHPACVAHCLSW